MWPQQRPRTGLDDLTYCLLVTRIALAVQDGRPAGDCTENSRLARPSSAAGDLSDALLLQLSNMYIFSGTSNRGAKASGINTPGTLCSNDGHPASSLLSIDPVCTPHCTYEMYRVVHIHSRAEAQASRPGPRGQPGQPAAGPYSGLDVQYLHVVGD